MVTPTIVYRQTPVVIFDAKTIILNPGGWYTNATKSRMNQASNQYNLGYRVFSRHWKWYVDYQGEVIPFTNSTLILKRQAQGEGQSLINPNLTR